MLRPLLQRLGLICEAAGDHPPPDLPDLNGDIAPMLVTHEGLPQINWDIAMPWIERQTDDPERQWPLVRAVGAAWLQTLAPSIKSPHARFRTSRAEGLAPLDLLDRFRVATTRSVRLIESALRPIRDDEPAPPFAVIGLADHDTYLDFTSHFHPDEGEWATSGGMYLSGGWSVLPIIVLPLNTRDQIEGTIAHEFTHHCLSHMELPLWVEEGLTQMMEERVTDTSRFRIDREVLARHRHRWAEDGLDGFLTGESFTSPHEDRQELSYHLAQILVRSQLEQNAKAFFAFAREASRQDAGDAAARKHLGAPLDQITARTLAAMR